MNIKELLYFGYQNVKNKTDVRKLLSNILKISFEEMIINSNRNIDNDIFDEFKTKILKLKEGYPLAYILNKKEFYGREFYVDENVLIPREETEMIIDIVSKRNAKNILDMCCGSGVIGITLDINTDSKLTLCDVSKEAINVSKRNAKKLNASVDIIESNLFENVYGKFDLIVSNPPYIKKDDLDKLPLLSFEPYIALYGGDNGLIFYERILDEAKDYLLKDGIIVFEIGYNQMEDLKKLAKKYGYSVLEEYKDVFGLDRFIMLRI